MAVPSAATLPAIWNRGLARLARPLAAAGHWRLAAALLRLSLGDDVVSVHGPRLERNWSDVTFAFCAAGAYGPFLAGFLAGRTGPFDFLDIGANQGLYALVAAANPAARAVHAFEPVPQTFARLQRNIALNGAPVVAHPFAIAERAGTATFRLEPTHTGGAGEAARGEPVTVETRARAFLDGLAPALAAPLIVKIDVEGAEETVLAELLASALLPKISHLFVETRAATEASVAARLGKAGFALAARAAAGPVHDLMFARALEPSGPAS